MTIKVPWPATPEEVAKLPRNAVHDMIDELIMRLDDQDGDADLETEDPDLEPDGTEADQSFTEWHTRGRHKLWSGSYEGPAMLEDAEDDEGGGDTCGDEGEPDFSKPPQGYGPGCEISDSGEPNGDVEPNGDEGDYDLGVPV